MYRLFNDFRLATLAALVLLSPVGADLALAAGLVGYRNDTNQALVVQSTVTANGVTRHSKPQTLYPGEVALDGLAYTGTRQIAVYDPKKPDKPIHQADATCGNDDLFYSIRVKAATVPIKGQPPRPPEIELVKTTPPAMHGKSAKPPAGGPMKK